MGAPLGVTENGSVFCRLGSGLEAFTALWMVALLGAAVPTDPYVAFGALTQVRHP